MKAIHAIFLIPLLGCVPVSEVQPPAQDTVAAATVAPPPPRTARTVDEFDTTTQAQREAAARASGTGALLGRTVVSLGDPTMPGFWVETPLVSGVVPGRLENPGNGKSVEVELRPGASSRASLAALRLIEAPIAELTDLLVYAR